MIARLLVTALPHQFLAVPRSRSSPRLSTAINHAMGDLRAAEFEVHGRVQGVWFRACTEEQARNLGVVGWVANTPSGSVRGEVQGERGAVDKMMVWLAKEGSPHSCIDRCDFANERKIDGLEYMRFEVRRGRH